MFLVYSDTKEPFTGQLNWNDLDPNAIWKKHLENHFYLNFILHKSHMALEKIQAGKEIDIAERKMKFWSKHPFFEKSRSERDMSELKRIWSEKSC